MKMPISRSNAFRRSILAVATARKGDPNATLNAYPVTRRPAWGIVTPRSPATSGNSPMMTNSVVPMPNEARARANKGRRLAEAGVLGARGMIALQQDDRCPARWTDEASHLHLCCLLPQALPSKLKIVGGPAGTIKLPFRKLNSILCAQLGERASKATPKLCASIESATFKRLPAPAAKDLSPRAQLDPAEFDRLVQRRR